MGEDNETGGGNPFEPCAQTPATTLEPSGIIEPDNYNGMIKLMGLVGIKATPELVRMDLPVTERLHQGFGFLHGGATLALLESCASWGTVLNLADDSEMAFGTAIECRHLNSVANGIVHGESTLTRCDDLGERGRRYVWHIRAWQNGPDGKERLVSEGEFTCRIVSRAYFESREERTAHA